MKTILLLRNNAVCLEFNTLLNSLEVDKGRPLETAYICRYRKVKQLKKFSTASYD